MSSDYQIQVEDVSAVVDTLQKGAAQIDEQLSSLKSYVISVEDVWGGISHDAFVDLMTQYDADTASLNKALADIATALKANVGNYSDSDITGKKNLDRIAHDLPAGNLN